MGHKSDQNYFPETYRPSEQEDQVHVPSTPPQRAPPPPLPPRADTTPLTPSKGAPPAYSETAPTYHSQPLSHSWSSQDPRSSSTQSLVPHQSTDGDDKRTLLLVYIHGFMGNETSFQSFPAHVHNIVTIKLAETHVVHTKIYPKYKSRKAIEFARDGFSEWLRPHESRDTDVILLGHSMGGILGAEVALLESHRILGTINFDTPFLGMHPGVIASGLGSLFRPAPESPAIKQSETRSHNLDLWPTPATEGTQSSASSSYFGSGSTFMPAENSSVDTLPMLPSLSRDLPVKDPNYDPPFSNDVRMPQRTGWSNAWHFINKHSDGLAKATQSYVKSHLEFGGAMADYNGLKNRYAKLRALEDVDERKDDHATRIRFVNYYTASTGRPKKPKPEPTDIPRSRLSQVDGQTESSRAEQDMQSMSLEAQGDGLPVSSPQISVEKAEDRELDAEDRQGHDEIHLGASDTAQDDEDVTTSDASHDMEHLDPAPITDHELEKEAQNLENQSTLQLTQSTKTSESELSKPPSKPSSTISSNPSALRKSQTLPPLPSAPEEPSPFDPTPYTDKDTRKLAEKENARQIKAYKQAVKDRDRAITDRRKFLEKREKNAAKEREKQVKLEEKEIVKQAREDVKRQGKEQAKAEQEELKKCSKNDAAPLAKTQSKTSEASKPHEEEPKSEKPKRDKKFCMLPPTINNRPDSCWIRVFMPDVDEVGAHCGLFFVDGERYELFVNGVAQRIEDWVAESEGIEKNAA